VRIRTVRPVPLLLAVVLLGTLVIPFAVLPRAFDAFRLPKEMALRAEALLILAITLGALVLGFRERIRFDRWLILPTLALTWMAIVAITSTNPALSAVRLAAGAATLIVFVTTLWTAEGGSAYLRLLALPLGAATVNAIVDILEELNLWMPFPPKPELTHHFQCNAFIGNPNEVGSYLAVGTLACLAAAIADRARRTWFGIAAVVLTAGVVASQTLTALMALVAGAIVLFALISWKHALAVAVTPLLIVACVAPLRDRAVNMTRWFRSGEYNLLVSDRLTPAVSAVLMTADHPLTGVGPGAFGWNYFEYKQRAERRFPLLQKAWSRDKNFGEVHNDHLQVLAEAGVPGYVIFVALAAMLAAISLRGIRDGDSAPQRFAVLLALPLAVLWLVLSLAQFPLETPAVRMLIVHFAALSVAWRS
jgi:O-antigen ligase